jgi:hypothetical protein
MKTETIKNKKQRTTVQMAQARRDILTKEG